MKVAKIFEGKEANTRWGQDDWRPNREVARTDTDEELIVQTCGRELNLRLIFVAAEDDADGWIVVGSHHLLLEIIEVEIHLSGVPMTKRSDLEIQQYVAAKETMVKD